MKPTTRTAARTARPSTTWPAWAALNHAQHVEIAERVLRQHGAAIPPATAGQGVAARARQLWTALENAGLEQAAQAEAPALPKDPGPTPTAAPKARDLWAEFNAIADGAERTAFYQANRNAFLLLARR
jgi:hypothetical protein